MTAGKRWIVMDEEDAGKIELEEYIPGAVAACTPITYETETLKAQAVILRTHILLMMGERQSITEKELKLNHMNPTEMQTAWGYQEFAEQYEKIKSAVQATYGQVVLYQNELIYPPFHAVSAGKTRNGNEIAGKQVYPYLQSVDSSQDLESEEYLKIEYYERSEFVNLLRTYDETIVLEGESLENAIRIEREDESGYVKNILLNNGQIKISGEEFRNLLELNSTCFYIEDYEGNIRIVTKGLGHGIGFSEYGANQMAKQGSSYDIILQYYYKGTKIGTINE